MHDRSDEVSLSVRLLECWLPLAQELNEALGWQHDARTLERLVLVAAPLLHDAPSAAAARAILVVYHATLRATS
jgi:hypothetical protein